MKIRLVTSLREFDALAPIWAEVAEAGNHVSPFLAHDWFACCWRAAGPNRRREAWLFEDSAGPLAVLPLVLEKTRIRGLPCRVLTFMDSPDTAITDFPVARRLEDVIAVLVSTLRTRRDWDVLSLTKMPAAGGTAKALCSALAGQLPWRIAGSERSPYVALGGTWEAFFRDKTQRFRKTVRNVENRLQRMGKVTVEEHRTVDPEGPIFAELMEVSNLSWKGPRGLAIATMNGMQRFFRELTSRASANGWLHLWILRLDGRAVATEYQLAAGGSVHALRADFDAALRDVSPGTYLNAAMIQSLFERSDLEEYDMGPGANEYKLRWATAAHELLALQVYASTPYGRFLHRLETRMIPLARRWRVQLGRPAAS
jgi:CelD/BcsL family acetyltransferase involved in cellulose biosynthesis